MKYVTGYDSSYLAIICLTSDNFHTHVEYYLCFLFIDGREIASVHHSLWQLFVISVWLLYVSSLISKKMTS